jgi:tetratricopeptide (TPR) repeat protein
MKQKERHHLKENELAQSLAAATQVFAARRRQITGMLIVLGLVLVVVAGVFIIRQRTASRSQDLLAQAMVELNAPVQAPTPALPATDTQAAVPETQPPGTYATEEAKLKAALPKLQAAADAYPNSQAGQIARYHLAATLARSGRRDEAIRAYDAVIASAGDAIYGRMARLGKANLQAQMGQTQQAIATYQALLDDEDSGLPADAILMHMASAYQAAGNAEEARKTFSRIVHEHPASPYSAAAGKQIQ